MPLIKNLKYFFYIVVWITIFQACASTKKIKSGEVAYDLKQYALAIELFLDEYENHSNESRKSRIAFLLGKSYEKTLEYTEALEWYKRAADLQFGPEAIKHTGWMLKVQERYTDAIQIFELLASYPEYRQIAEKEKLICREANRWKAGPEAITLKKFNDTPGFSHYSPVIYRDKYVLLASDRPESNGKEIYTWTGRKYSDFFLFTREGQLVSSFDPAVNSLHNEGTACFSEDNNTMFFTRCHGEETGNDDCKIMVSYYSEGVWSEPENLSFIQPKIQYGHPALLENDSVLIFTSDLSDPGGTFDLYYSELDNKGTWSNPYPMPRTINTDGNEKFPTADGDTLYFSSDFLPGMGGYDIFKTYLRYDRTWSPPVNLKYPINSGGDDFSYMPDRGAKKEAGVLERGYFTSSRSKLGVDEVFVFRRTGRKIVPENNQPSKEKILYYVGGKTYEEVYEDNDPSKSKLPNRILQDTRVHLFDQDGVKKEEVRTGISGVFAFELDSGQVYILKADKPFYLTSTEEIDTREIVVPSGQNTFTIQKDIVLSKIYYDQEIVLDNIYYKFDKWDLTPEALPTLRLLAKMMAENPMIVIQLNAHTDCQGDDEYNLDLSQKRALSVVEYLISQGISPDRLVPVGHGESKPAVICACSNCTEEQYQKNRRTSFTILSRNE